MKTRSTYRHHRPGSLISLLAGKKLRYFETWGSPEEPGAPQLNRETKTIMEVRMNKGKYKINDLIKNEYGLGLQVQDIDHDSGKTDNCYKTVCTDCGYIFEKVAKNLEKQRFCAGCAVKSAVLGFDTDGEIISINGIGLVEYISDFQEKYEVSERETFDVVIEIFKKRPGIPIVRT